MPGRSDGNWGWRYTPAMLTDEVKLRLREMTETYGRCEVAVETAKGV